MKRFFVLFLLLAIVMMSTVALPAGVKQTANDSKIVDKMLKRGTLRCGISGSSPGFSLETEPGVFEGFDVDMCRVVAAAVLGDADAVEFVPLSAQERFAAVADGTVDVLMRTTTNTLGRDAEGGLNFGPTTFYDGQGTLVDSASEGLGAITEGSTIADLPDGESGATVCLPTATSFVDRFLAAAAAAGKTFNVVESSDAMDDFLAGVCDVITSDRSALGSFRTSQDAADWVVLNETISKEPLAPVVADGDDGWMSVVEWAVSATFYADELGITSTNIDARRDDIGRAHV